MAEQLALDELLGNRAAVDGNEGALGPRGEVVQGARDQLLACSALAGDQHRRPGRRDLLQKAQHLLHRGRLGDDATGASRRLDLPPQAAVLGPKALAFLGLAQYEKHFVGTKRLPQVVVRPCLHRLERQVVRPVRAHHDHRGVRRLFLHGANELQPVDARHPHVGDERVVVAGRQLAHRFVAVLHRADEIAVLGQEHRQDVPDRLLVVGDENRAQRHAINSSTALRGPKGTAGGSGGRRCIRRAM